MTGDKMRLRLALREDGPWWNAYVAPVGTMDKAVLIGSISMSAARDNQALKNSFIELMKVTMQTLIESGTGIEIAWPNGAEPAPEHERSGHG